MPLPVSCLEGSVSPHCFNILTQDEWEQVSKGQQLFRFMPGEVISRQGAPTATVMFMISGIARQYIESDTTRPFNISIVKPGEFTGLTAIFGERRFTTSVAALSELEVCMMTIDVMRSLVEHNIAFALRLFQRHLQEEKHLIDTVARLNYKQMPGKLAQTLLYLTQDSLAALDVTNYLSRVDLANFVGISHINVVKLLHQFEAEGLVRLDKRRITVPDRNALEQVALRG